MGSNIKFSPAEATRISRSIGSSRGQIESEVRKLHNLIKGDLCEKWEGEASRKYLAEFEALKKDVMDKFIKMLEELEKQLKSISAAMEDADKQIAGKISMR